MKIPKSLFATYSSPSHLSQWMFFSVHPGKIYLPTTFCRGLLSFPCVRLRKTCLCLLHTSPLGSGKQQLEALYASHLQARHIHFIQQPSLCHMHQLPDHLSDPSANSLQVLDIPFVLESPKSDTVLLMVASWAPSRGEWSYSSVYWPQFC